MAKFAGSVSHKPKSKSKVKSDFAENFSNFFTKKFVVTKGEYGLRCIDDDSEDEDDDPYYWQAFNPGDVVDFILGIDQLSEALKFATQKKVSPSSAPLQVFEIVANTTLVNPKDPVLVTAKIQAAKAKLTDEELGLLGLTKG